MPFLGRRIKENLFVYLLMGLLYSIIYKNVSMPDTVQALHISYGGALVVAMFLYVYCMYTYLMNVGDLPCFIRVNIVAYAVYVVVFYALYAAAALLGGVFLEIYRIFFQPFSVFGFLGLSSLVSSVIVHILNLAVIFVVPFFIRDNYDPTEDYFNSVENSQ